MTAKRLVALSAALAVAGAIAPASAAGQSACCYPQQANAIVLSPDGHFAYAVSDVVQTLRRDPLTGTLETLDVEEGGGEGAVLAPDGRHLYAGPFIFARDPITGGIDRRAQWKGEGSLYLSFGENTAFRDDRTLYMTDSAAGVVKVLDRDPATGWVKARRDIPAGPPPGERPLGGVVLSPDGQWLYVAGATPAGGIGVFRVRGDGDLEPVSGLDCACGRGQIEITPDGARIVVRRDSSITTAERNADGTLNTPRTVAVPFHESGGNFALAPDGKSLFMVDVRWGYRGTIVQYDNRADGLVARRAYDRADGVVGPHRVAVSHDGRHVYVGSGTELVNPSTISVHERGSDGELTHVSTYVAPLYTGRPYGGSPPRLLINHGMPYTNDPDVELSFTGLGSRDREIQISNDGGFGYSETRQFALGVATPGHWPAPVPTGCRRPCTCA